MMCVCVWICEFDGAHVKSQDLSSFLPPYLREGLLFGKLGLQASWPTDFWGVLSLPPVLGSRGADTHHIWLLWVLGI